MDCRSPIVPGFSVAESREGMEYETGFLSPSSRPPFFEQEIVDELLAKLGDESSG